MISNHSLRNGRFQTIILPAPSPVITDAEPIYSLGDTVMHPSEGVCTVAELRRMELGSVGMKNYYILKPTTEKSSSTIYMPVARGNTVLRRLLSKEDILSLIRASKEHAGLWIADSKQRKEAFTRILSEGNYARIIRMIQEIHEERIHREQEGKKPCAADEALLAEAERLLHQEFSYVLHMSVEEIAAFIRKELITD